MNTILDTLTRAPAREIDEGEVREIELTKIVVNQFQPRRHFAQTELEELAESIKAVGLIHPPVVRPCDDGQTYELVSGERRLRASQIAGLVKIPVMIRRSSNSISAQAALIENIQRVDLNPIEIAKALRSLIEQFGFNQDELSHRIGKKRSTVTNYLRLLSLPKNIQDSIFQNHMTMGHAKAIMSLEGFEKQNLLHEIILRDELTVREAEDASLRIAEKAKKQRLIPLTRDFFLEQLAERIQQKLGTKVTIQGKGKRGKIYIDYYSLDDLDRLMGIFGVDA